MEPIGYTNRCEPLRNPSEISQIKLHSKGQIPKAIEDLGTYLWLQGGIHIRWVFPKPPKKDFHSDKWLVGESLTYK